LTGTAQLTGEGSKAPFVPQFLAMLQEGNKNVKDNSEAEGSRGSALSRTASSEGKYDALGRDELLALLKRLDEDVTMHVRSLQTRARDDRQLLQAVGARLDK
jgi:hypothetical protein